MKKVIVVLVMVLGFYFMLGTVTSLVIPEDAIRIRVIANSNNDYDLEMKAKVKDAIQYKMYDLLKDAKGSNQARTIIQSNLKIIDAQIINTLQTNNYDLGHELNYGLNYFPNKTYKGIEYEEGYYESLVITLGKGNGDNWWCVLFPPLCLLEAEESDEVEYTSLVKELIKKYL